MWNWVVTDQGLPAGQCISLIKRLYNQIMFVLFAFPSNLDNLDNEIAKAEKLRTTSSQYSFSRLASKTSVCQIEPFWWNILKTFWPNNYLKNRKQNPPHRKLAENKSPGVLPKWPHKVFWWSSPPTIPITDVLSKLLIESFRINRLEVFMQIKEKHSNNSFHL